MNNLRHKSSTLLPMILIVFSLFSCSTEDLKTTTEGNLSVLHADEIRKNKVNKLLNWLIEDGSITSGKIGLFERDGFMEMKVLSEKPPNLPEQEYMQKLTCSISSEVFSGSETKLSWILYEPAQDSYLMNHIEPEEFWLCKEGSGISKDTDLNKIISNEVTKDHKKDTDTEKSEALITFE